MVGKKLVAVAVVLGLGGLSCSAMADRISPDQKDYLQHLYQQRVALSNALYKQAVQRQQGNVTYVKGAKDAKQIYQRLGEVRQKNANEEMLLYHAVVLNRLNEIARSVEKNTAMPSAGISVKTFSYPDAKPTSTQKGAMVRESN